MSQVFYDIESLRNVFTICFFNPGNKPVAKPEKTVFDGTVTLYYLIDDEELDFEDTDEEMREFLEKRMLEKNSNFKGKLRMHNLRNEKANIMLAKGIGVSDLKTPVNDPSAKDSMNNMFRPVCDTDPNYDENKHPFLMGYNSYNYDTTMLARYFDMVFYTKNRFVATTAKTMRNFNDKLFTPEYKDSMPKALTIPYSKHRTGGERIRKNMFMSGRHIDVARLNEKQSKVGLKRLLGMLGYQILESNKLSSGTDVIYDMDELADLIAYNASDVINLYCLFLHRNYQAQFMLKKQLLKTYPELIYERKIDEYDSKLYEPNISPYSVRVDRLFVDSSSAQFATKCLCPYDCLEDISYVSYMYPSDTKAKELGIKPVNVLEETKKFFYSNFKQPEIRAEFDKIYNFYKSLEGKNFNDSSRYIGGYTKVVMSKFVAENGKINGCIPYYNKDGSPSNCFAVFGIGGIHGAEYNKSLYEADLAEYEKQSADLKYVQEKYPEPTDLRKAKTVLMPDGTERPYTDFLKSGATMKKAAYRTVEEPKLFSCDSKGNWQLNGKYVYTSASDTNHEDFTSYYPNMLRMMSAFWNEGLGYDRYAEIFEDKQKYGKLMKDPSLSDEEREFYRVMREGTKLILNSASGAADTNFNSPIQMNNRILSMRIIGQLFSWRIGQAQTIAGARIISTNTDGLYSVLEPELNNRILAEESASIGVEIEPEPLFLISKDSNNRLELTDGNITSASGGTVACRKGPDPGKALAHPAIIDWALSEYLIRNSDDLSRPFDKEQGMSILNSAYDAFKEEYDNEHDTMVHMLLMFQNVIASSPATFKYKYGLAVSSGEVVPLSHYNRTFILKDDASYLGAIHLVEAAARKVDSKIVAKRKKNGEPLYTRNDEKAMSILKKNGVFDQEIAERDVITQKVTNVDPLWNVAIINRSLYSMTDFEMKELLDDLNYDAYLELLSNAYESWQNETPSEPEEKTEMLTLF